MAQVSLYKSAELPVHLKWQLIALVRYEWSWIFQGDGRFWHYIYDDKGAIHAVIHEQDLVISHAEVNMRFIEHAGQSYHVYGLSAVFTAPAFRKEGYGQQVVKAATDYINESDADVAMVFCLENLRTFYESAGWVSMSNIEVTHGDPAQPQLHDEEIMLMLFVSDRAKQQKAQFEGTSIYLGTHTW